MNRGLATLLLMLAAAPASAWGPEGHRIVAQIAAEHLTRPQARAGIAALLAGEPEPSLPGVANWSDEIRSQQPETGPLHYINLPQGDCRYRPQRDCPGGLCAVGGIEQAIAVLKFGGATREQRKVALKNLVHFVGDLHQPLHAGLAEDRGGNGYAIESEQAKDNLHRVWDSGLIARSEPDWRRYAIRLAPRAAAADLVSLDPADWAMASCAIVQSPDFYPADHRAGEAYFARWQPVVDAQLNLAGLRLAALLDSLF
ncbi:MAG: S1/P1 nuclease [Nevskia sp.]